MCECQNGGGAAEGTRGVPVEVTRDEDEPTAAPALRSLKARAPEYKRRAEAALRVGLVVEMRIEVGEERAGCPGA